jgi:hypothetical protein
MHTRCGEDCVCNCDAAHAEHEAATLRTQLAAAERERRDALSYALDVVAERDAATSRAETAEGLLRAIVEADDGAQVGGVAWGMPPALRAARSHLQSLKGGSEPTVQQRMSAAGFFTDALSAPGAKEAGGDGDAEG